MQELEVAGDAERDRMQNDLRVAAFTGWQYVRVWAGEKAPDWKRYLESMGLIEREPMTPEARQAEVAKGYAVLERARAAFAQRAA